MYVKLVPIMYTCKINRNHFGKLSSMTRSQKKRPPSKKNTKPGAPRNKASADRSAELVKIVNPIVEKNGLYLESVKIGRAGGRSVVRVTVDLPYGPGGVGSDQLTDVSREISKCLDDADLVAGAYTLEVSTPGLSRPLVEPRHFSRAIGHVLKIKPVDGESHIVRLENVEGDTLVLRTQDKAQREWRLRIADVAVARMEVEFGRGPDDKDELE